MITYKTIIEVRLDNKHVGNIIEVSGGVTYIPKGHKKIGGFTIYPSIEACKLYLRYSN